LAESFFAVPQTNLHDIILPDILEPVKLSDFLFFHCVHTEMLIGHDDFLFESVNLFLFLLLEFFHHVFAGDENRLEKGRVREVLLLRL